jgi:hypothetical protein
VLVVLVDGVADGIEPLGFATGGDELVLSEVEGLEHGLGEVGESASGARLDIATRDGDEDVSEGGVEIVGGEVVAGEEPREIFGELLAGAGTGVFFGVMVAEVGTGGDARGTATAAVGESETAKRSAVLRVKRWHKKAP